MAGSQERENEIRVQIMGTNGGRCTNHWVFFFLVRMRSAFLSRRMENYWKLLKKAT